MQLQTILQALLVGLLFFAQDVHSANNWQQKVDYKIDVSLDDTKHELTGFITLNYTNNSPTELPFIWFHLWPNAYLNDQTAFAKQQIENRNTEFYYAKKSDRGFIDKLDFKANNTPVKTEADPQNPDIAKLYLNKPLKPGETVEITTPFHVKIPESVSRLGHVGQSYQITQWYPKPAVYDQLGWHQMPYLDQGEFYSEYGSFDVSITLPKNYIVGATGDLQNDDEQAFLNEKAAETQAMTSFDNKNYSSFPPSETTTKTLHYLQQNIHDFGWFADKRFHVLKDVATLPSGRKVDCWAMFTNQEADIWMRGAEYVKRAVEFYSTNVGEYPYKQATALQSALSAGAGMEYPNVTVIGLSGNAKELDVVITHEVGHNWFYGQLGSNEREHAWMDEGINSYYEMRYIETYYPPKEKNKVKGTNLIRALASMADLSSTNGRYITYLLTARRNEDQPIELHSKDYTNLNYGAIVYEKTAIVFRYLESYLGTKAFDQIMKKYYTQYEFKHPQPADIRRVFEQETGKDLTWFFDQLIGSSAKIDYRIKHVKKNTEKIGNTQYDQITVKQGKSKRDAQGNPVGAFGNFTYVKGPFPISAIKDNKIIKTIWYDGFNGEADLLFNHIDYDKLTIDPAHNIPESNRLNNTWHSKGLCKTSAPLKFKFLGGLENNKSNNVFWLPALGFNNYDKLMLGMAFYNPILPNKAVEYALVPMFATGNKSFSGIGTVDFNFYPKNPNKWWKKLQITVGGSTFGTGTYELRNKYEIDTTRAVVESKTAKYSRFTDVFTLTLKPKTARSSITNALHYRDVWVWHRQFTNPNPSLYNASSEASRPNTYTAELGWEMSNRRVINPFSVKANILSDFKDYSLATLITNYRLSWKKKKRSSDVRLFVGGFLQNKADAKRQLTTSDGASSDYFMDDFYFGRYEIDGLWSKQVAIRNGGFKLPTAIGRTDQFLAAANFKSNLPIPFVKVYADIALPLMSDANAFGHKTFLYDAGLYLSIIPNTFEIYLPLFHAKIFKDAFDANNTKWYEKISFMLNIKRLNGLQQVRNFTL